MPDLTTFGETMLRLCTPRGERLETTTELEFRTAGAESNVAIAATALGVEASWLSKVPENPLGRRIVRDVRANGVQAAVAWDTDPSSRAGTYYIEPGGEPRGTNVVYDRAGSAITTATPAELSLDHVRESSVFCTSGITPALSETLLDTTVELLKTARSADTQTVLDVNYRASLWSPSEARETIERLLPLVDVVVTAERDATTVLGREGDAEDIAAGLREDYDFEVAIVARGRHGLVAATTAAVHRQPAYPADTVDPIGTGDALLGGFLAARLAGHSISDALDYGAATAAFSRTLNGDWAIASWEDIEAVRSDEGGISR